MWLCDCGLVHKVSRVTVGKLPLKVYEDIKAFKMFVLDVGLLVCMTGLSHKILLEGNELFVEFKGALTEQYVLQQLISDENLQIYYYTNDGGSCEIDFIADNGERVIPIEVKAELNLRAKSLKSYIDRFAPDLAVRTSMADYKTDGKLTDLPLYAVENLSKEADR